MHILFACPLHDPDAWVPRLQAAMPGCRISVWDPEGPPSGAEAALVWRPPAELFAHEQGIRTLFNLGAGVDALLKMKEIPPQISIVRLEDAGMSVQMAEYALYALLRVSRDFQAFDEAQARQHWDTREGTRPADWPVGVLGLGQVGARVAQTLAGFGYPVAGWSRTPRDLPGVQSYAGEQALPAFLARTRFLVNVLPLTPDTGYSQPRYLVATVAGRAPGQRRPRRPPGRGRLGRDAGRARSPAPRWTCSAPNPCRRTILSGAIPVFM